MKNIKVDYLWGLLSALCLAVITPLGKISLVDISAETILFVRYVLCLVIILITSILVNKYKLLKIPFKKIPMLFLTGVMFALETALFWIALDKIDIIPFISLFWSYPIMLFIIDVVGKELEFNWRIPIIVIVGFIGVFLAWGGF